MGLFCSTNLASSLTVSEQVDGALMVAGDCQKVLLRVTLAPHFETASVESKIKETLDDWQIPNRRESESFLDLYWCSRLCPERMNRSADRRTTRRCFPQRKFRLPHWVTCRRRTKRWGFPNLNLEIQATCWQGLKTAATCWLAWIDCWIAPRWWAMPSNRQELIDLLLADWHRHYFLLATINRSPNCIAGYESRLKTSIAYLLTVCEIFVWQLNRGILGSTPSIWRGKRPCNKRIVIKMKTIDARGNRPPFLKTYLGKLEHWRLPGGKVHQRYCRDLTSSSSLALVLLQ